MFRILVRQKLPLTAGNILPALFDRHSVTVHPGQLLVGVLVTFQCRVPHIEFLGALVLAACALSCGGGGATSPPPPPPISVSISPSAATVEWGGTSQLTATVGNDSSNSGGKWIVSCSSTPCGALSSTSTASGKPATYSPPVTLPAGNLSVKLMVASVADPTKSAAATITVRQLASFSGVSEAHLDMVNRVTRLIINGKPAPPLWFQYSEGLIPSHISVPCSGSPGRSEPRCRCLFDRLPGLALGQSEHRPAGTFPMRIN
jgi:hypothetical protein